jgi:hypothetical protein
LAAPARRGQNGGPKSGVNRMKPVRALVLALVMAAAPRAAFAAELPMYVAGPFSGFVYDCQQEKQKPPKRADFITEVDLDGDGKADYVFDIARGCAANKALYCNNDEGCKISIYLSSAEMASPSGDFKVKSWRVVRDGKAARIVATMAGEVCGPTKPPGCEKTLRFRGEAFVAE